MPYRLTREETNRLFTRIDNKIHSLVTSGKIQGAGQNDESELIIQCYQECCILTFNEIVNKHPTDSLESSRKFGRIDGTGLIFDYSAIYKEFHYLCHFTRHRSLMKYFANNLFINLDGMYEEYSHYQIKYQYEYNGYINSREIYEKSLYETLCLTGYAELAENVQSKNFKAKIDEIKEETQKKTELKLAPDNNTPNEYLCPISHEIMTDPVIDEVGNTYERKEIERWFIDNNTDPLTNTVLQSKRLFPNNALKKLISDYLVTRSDHVHTISPRPGR